MLKQAATENYVVSTGETYSVKEFVEAAFGHVNLDWKKYVVTDPNFFRPAEVNLLLGDCSKAKKKLGWQPKVKFQELVRMMVQNDLDAVLRENNIAAAALK